VVIAQMLAGPVGGAFGEYVGWRGVFLLLAAFGAVIAALLAFRLHRLPDRVGEFTFRWSNYGDLARAPVARLLLIATVVEGALLPGCFPFIAPYLTSEFGLSYGLAGLVLASFGVGAFAYTRNARAFVAQLGEDGLVLLGGGLIAAVLVMGMASPRWTKFLVVEAAIGLGYFSLHTVLQARATELLPNARSTAVSTFVFLLFLGQAVGALAMGSAIAAFGYRAAFLGDAAGIVLLTSWLFVFIRRTAQQPLAAAALVANRSRHAP
jgi:predicted MFS family arabinose efflux permease